MSFVNSCVCFIRGTNLSRRSSIALTPLLLRFFNQKELLSPTQFVSVLRLATKWSMASVRQFAIAELEDQAFGGADKVAAAREFSVPGWELDGLADLAKRDAPMSMVEVEKIGIQTVVEISALREMKCEPRCRGFDPSPRLVARGKLDVDYRSLIKSSILTDRGVGTLPERDQKSEGGREATTTPPEVAYSRDRREYRGEGLAVDGGRERGALSRARGVLSRAREGAEEPGLQTPELESTNTAVTLTTTEASSDTSYTGMGQIPNEPSTLVEIITSNGSTTSQAPLVPRGALTEEEIQNAKDEDWGLPIMKAKKGKRGKKVCIRSSGDTVSLPVPEETVGGTTAITTTTYTVRDT